MLEEEMKEKEILRVKVNDIQMKKIYGLFSKFYGFVEKIEKGLRKKGLELLNLKEGEIALEIGFGKGTSLVEMAKSVGEKGKVYGIDLTPVMVESAKQQLARKGLLKRVELYEGDAKKLPYKDNMFDAVYIASTLELFDTDDIPRVLMEVKRVLKTSGRLCVVSIPREGRENTFALKAYEWFYRTFPNWSSCRPIYVEESVINAGYKIIQKDESFMTKFFPMKIVIAKPLNRKL